MNARTVTEISVVIPVYNEAESVALLHEEVRAALDPLGRSYEILFVDDGSTDGTYEALAQLSSVRVIRLARNFGKSQALSAGFTAARGALIFTLDGDLQDDPREMGHFLEGLERSNADLVCGWKQQRRDDIGKRAVSQVANALTRFFTGTAVHDMNCGFKLYRREVALTLDLHGDMHRYIPALAAAQGFRVIEIPVHHRARQFGVSKYGNFRRVSRASFDFVTLLLVRRFVDRPMHFFGILGSLLGAVGGAILVYLAYLKLALGAAIGNRPLLLLGTLLVVIGMQLFSSGFLGELVIRQNGRRKVYAVREEIERP